MDGSGAPHDDAIARWREAGADRLDPLRFHRIEALRRRAAALTGEARRAVDAKLAALVADHADALARSEAPRRDVSPTPPAPGALAALVDLLAQHSSAAAAAPAADANAKDAGTPAGDDTAAAPRDLDSVQDLRRIWSDVRLRSQLRDSLRPAPEHAGPLNSTRLVHRALALMHEVSPGYLQHFMAYVDALSSLQRLDAARPSPEAAPRRGKRQTSHRPQVSSGST